MPMRGSGLISIIIPVFNVRPYLETALESVIRQTYSHLEIIVIDDGSTDGSGVICDELAKRDDRIKVVHQENRGLSSARNTGLDMMSGDAVAFLDSDDSSYFYLMREVLYSSGIRQTFCIFMGFPFYFRKWLGYDITAVRCLRHRQSWLTIAFKLLLVLLH